MAFRNGKTSCALCDTGGAGPTPGPLDRRIVHAVVTVAAAANTDVSGPSNDANLDTDLGDLSSGSFITGYDVILNGNRERAALAAGVRDVYPGTSLASGQLRFDKKLKVGDKITLIDWDE
jgi:hypothetical protein